METKTMAFLHEAKQAFSEDELHKLGYEYTYQNFSKYLIYRKGESYYLMNKIEHDQFEVAFNFEEN